jgi:four helix bundle protein
MKSFRDLRVWQTMDLVEIIYRLTQAFPKEELYGLRSQIRRAIVSVPSNLAEGHTREHIKEYLHHVSMAQASLAEVETQLEIASRLRYLPRQDLRAISTDISTLGKQLYALRNALSRSNRDSPITK